jgi:DNA-binding beta-propeller fold protein YncE
VVTRACPGQTLTRATTVGYRCTGPTDVVVDTAGNVYITDPGNDRVLKLSPG